MYLLIGDLHLTDRPRDAYRFDIFKWIKRQQEIYKPDATVLMGDTADKKDRHPASLVNRIVEEITSLHKPVYILKGNHDYTDPNNPFFRFLNHVEGVYFITEPEKLGNGLFIPHFHEEDAFKGACAKAWGAIDFVFLHNTFEGAIAETGASLSGFSMAPVTALKPRLGVFAGDVHRPHKSGPITYVGAPYSVRFGDNFTPRCMLAHDDGRTTNLYFDCPRKWGLTIQSADELLKNKELLEGDQIKVTVELPREEIVHWKAHKQSILEACKKLGLEVFGIDLKSKPQTLRSKKSISASTQQPLDVLMSFCKAEKLSADIATMGMELLKG